MRNNNTALSQITIILLLIIPFFIITSGCAPRIETALTIKPSLTEENINATLPHSPQKTVILLPLADYSQPNELKGVVKRQRRLYELMAYALQRRGYNVIREEAIWKYLIKNNIISIKEISARSDSKLDDKFGLFEMDWSPKMKGYLNKYINAETDGVNKRASGTYIEGLSRVQALNSASLRKMASIFGADFVIGGRIISWEKGQEVVLDPFKQGVLPFIFNISGRLFYGLTPSSTYDFLQKWSIWGAVAGAFGDQSAHPFEKEEFIKGVPPFHEVAVRHSDARLWNSLFWAGVAGGAAHLAQKGGKTPKAAIQIRLYLFNGRDGHPVWSDMSQAVASPQTIFSPVSEKELEKEALNLCLDSLFLSFDKWAQNIASSRANKVKGKRSDLSYIRPQKIVKKYKKHKNKNLSQKKSVNLDPVFIEADF